MYQNFMKRFSLLLFIIFCVTALGNVAFAQDRQQSAKNSLLPEIDPQSIEIRSQFKARFPGLQRQPILGFEPATRIHQIDPNRMPFMETPEQVVADLPVSDLSRPDPPAYTPMHYSPDINAFARLGLGSFLTPEAQFWGVSRINSKSYVGGDLDYSSSSGHLDNQRSSFRFFNANGEYATKLNSHSRLGFQGGVENSFNQMPDFASLAATPDDARKEYGGFYLGADYKNHKNSIAAFKARANLRYFNSSLENAGSMISGESNELVYNGSLTKRWAGSNVEETFTVRAGAKGGSYDNIATASENWMTARGGVTYERLFNYRTKVTGDASIYYTKDALDSNFYVGPSIMVEHPVMNMLTVTVKGSAQPYLKTVEQLHSENRFISVNNTLQHSYRIKGSAEVRFDYHDLGSVNFGMQYENISDYPIFARSQTVGGYGFYEAIYRDVYKIRAYLGATHQLIPEKFWINGKIYFQSPKIQGGPRLPYEEKVGVNSGMHIRPLDKLSVEAWADYVGTRTTFRTNEELDAYLLVGGKVDYQITERFGAYIKLVNLLNQEYEVWQGYTERPFQAYGGVTVKL